MMLATTAASSLPLFFTVKKYFGSQCVGSVWARASHTYKWT